MILSNVDKDGHHRKQAYISSKTIGCSKECFWKILFTLSSTVLSFHAHMKHSNEASNTAMNYMYLKYFQEKKRPTAWHTVSVRCSVISLQLAENISPAPNSKYHILLRILEETAHNDTIRDTSISKYNYSISTTTYDGSKYMQSVNRCRAPNFGRKIRFLLKAQTWAEPILWHWNHGQLYFALELTETQNNEQSCWRIKPTHRLLNFCGWVSLMLWNFLAIDASYIKPKGKI